jgi:hypothetical protein
MSSSAAAQPWQIPLYATIRGVRDMHAGRFGGCKVVRYHAFARLRDENGKTLHQPFQVEIAPDEPFSFLPRDILDACKIQLLGPRAADTVRRGPTMCDAARLDLHFETNDPTGLLAPLSVRIIYPQPAAVPGQPIPGRHGIPDRWILLGHDFFVARRAVLHLDYANVPLVANQPVLCGSMDVFP